MPSSPQINALNNQLRASPQYAQWMRSQGIDPSRPIRLSDQQRRSFAAYLRTVGVGIPKGAEIDAAGNINEQEGFGQQLKRWGPVAGQVGLGIATGGMSLPASMAINAGAGAGLGAARGGWKGAATGAAIGAGSAYGGHLLRGGPSGALNAGPHMNQAIPPAISALGGVGGGTGMMLPAGGIGGGVLGALGNGARRVLGAGGDGGGNPAWQTAILAALSGLPALIAAKNSGMSDEEKALYAQLTQDIEDQRQDRGQDRALRDLQMRKIQYQSPLFQAVSRLAMNRLPTSVQQPFGEF